MISEFCLIFLPKKSFLDKIFPIFDLLYSTSSTKKILSIAMDKMNGCAAGGVGRRGGTVAKKLDPIRRDNWIS